MSSILWVLGAPVAWLVGGTGLMYAACRWVGDSILADPLDPVMVRARQESDWTAEDDEFLARANVRPLSSGVTRVER